MNREVEQKLELPELNQTQLDEETVGQLFRDIHLCTQVVEIILKRNVRGYVGNQQITLSEAQGLLQSGEIRGVQIRYIYDGVHWWDTLIRNADGISLTRIRHDSF